MIPAHGGTLIDRVVPAAKRAELAQIAADLPKIELNSRETTDLGLIANGAMSPLEGFMTRAEFDSVLKSMRLPNGLAWPLPVTLTLKSDALASHAVPFDAALVDGDGNVVGVIHVEEIFTADLKTTAESALATSDDAHPGVGYLKEFGTTYAGGKVTVLDVPSHAPFEEYDLSPRQTRELFERNGWRTICAFQTRNPIHRAHEYLIKCALETVDGFLIHPAMGETKSDDIPADIRMQCYLALGKHYFPEKHVALSTFPYAMRYAGPREAILHAILRQNYGCTHFIVGRDHAGVGNYYGTYDAQHIFLEFRKEELAIEPVFFEHSFFCKRCEGMASQKTCPHGQEDRVFLSGTKVREMLVNGEKLPGEFTRREVAEILERHYATA